MLPACERHGMGVICWSPLAGGWLTGKYRRDRQAPAGSRAVAAAAMRGRSLDDDPDTPARYDVVERLAAVAGEAGLPLSHMALAFVDAHPAVTAAIIGPRTPEQLEDALAASDVRLSADTLDAIDAVVRPGTDVAGVRHVSGNPYAARSRPELRRRPGA